MELNNKIQPIEISGEMKKSYLDYAMSVIAGRALPDVRDGLKPVHRRILYSMSELNLTPDKPYRKSARIVGDVLGKYHPHGDTAVYFAMVRMAQDFSTRGLLVDGHGNFGSVDGDSPAAMRYTEARMSKLALELLRDIDKETVKFIPNFDESLKEPSVLPCRFPNLLVNGSNGIAVGMATSIPPHNLGEVIDATIHLIDNEDCDVKDLMTFIQAPDFPTGATIVGKDSIINAYTKGRGKIKVRAKTHTEKLPKGKQQIIVTEIPYQVNKSVLIEKIAELVKDKKVEGISDIRDESNRDGMRIVIELKRDVDVDKVLTKLYKFSQLQDTFTIIMLALVDGVPKVLNLKQVLYYYVQHQKDVVIRRTKFDLNKVEARVHILEGLRIALDNLDEVIKLIRASKTTQEAKKGLVNIFKLSEIQAQAILDLRLQRLTGLEKDKIEVEYNELIQKIISLKEILNNDSKLIDVIKCELKEIKENYSDNRRTEILDDDIIIKTPKELFIDDFNCVCYLTESGYFKKVKTISNKGNNKLKDGDSIKTVIECNNKDELLVFGSDLCCHKFKLHTLQEDKLSNLGQYLPNVIGCDVLGMSILNEDNKYICVIYKNNKIAKVDLKSFETKQMRSKLANSLHNDEVLDIITLKDDDIQLKLTVTDRREKVVCVKDMVSKSSRNTQGVNVITWKNQTIEKVEIL